MMTTELLEWVKTPFRALLDRGKRTAPESRECPVCGRISSEFRSFGLDPRPDAQCPRCGALERHRLLWLYLSQRTNLFDGRRKTMLHVAPEECLEERFRRRLGAGYVTADLLNPRAMVTMDVTNIQYPNHSFDVIYCSHVLEHVVDDRRAMREFRRVMKPGGWAILVVPITAERTFEDPSVIDPAERLRVFGQEDHVRRYGPDYVDRLREAGFRVEVTTITDLVTAETATRMGLTEACGDIYTCS